MESHLLLVVVAEAEVLVRCSSHVDSRRLEAEGIIKGSEWNFNTGKIHLR